MWVMAMQLYILDDDAAMCRTLTRMVGGSDRSVRCFATPAAFLDELDALASGLVLLDINLPETSGIDVLTILAERRPAWPVVMVSGTTDVDDAIAAFRAGAVQFLRKPFRRNELDKAISEAERIGAERAAQLERAEQAAGINLSRRERQVLVGMTEGHQTKVIAHSLGISARTVDMHRARIFSKLSARNAVQAVAIARQLNLLACALG